MEKEAINKRFMTAVNHLLSSKTVGSKGELAEALGVKNTKFSEILNSRMNIGTDLAAIICVEYGINPNWLLTGRGSMIQGNQEQSASQTTKQPVNPDSPSSEAAVYYKMYKEKDAEAGELKEEVGILKERLRQLEKTQNSTDEHRASVEKEPDAFTTATSGGSGKDAVHIRRAASLQTSLPAKT